MITVRYASFVVQQMPFPSLTGHLLVRPVLWCWHDSELFIDTDDSAALRFPHSIGQFLSAAPVTVAMVTVAEEVVCD